MTSYDEMLKETTDILSKHVDIDRPITPKDHIQNDLGLDSLSVWELASDVETRFGINIPTETFAQVATVADMARLVSTLQSGGGVAASDAR